MHPGANPFPGAKAPPIRQIVRIAVIDIFLHATVVAWAPLACQESLGPESLWLGISGGVVVQGVRVHRDDGAGGNVIVFIADVGGRVVEHTVVGGRAQARRLPVAGFDVRERALVGPGWKAGSPDHTVELSVRFGLRAGVEG